MGLPPTFPSGAGTGTGGCAPRARVDDKWQRGVVPPPMALPPRQPHWPSGSLADLLLP